MKNTTNDIFAVSMSAFAVDEILKRIRTETNYSYNHESGSLKLCTNFGFEATQDFLLQFRSSDSI